MTPRRTIRSESGYSLVELLISTAIMLVVTGAIFGLVNPSQGTGKSPTCSSGCASHRTRSSAS